MTQQEFLSRRQTLLAQMQPQRGADFRRTGGAQCRFGISLPAEQRFLVLHRL